MITLCKFWDAEKHDGEKFSIAVKQPKGFDFATLHIFVPEPQMLWEHKKAKLIDYDKAVADYESKYKKTINARSQDIKTWLDSLSPDDDLVLCCWEPSHKFCHRQLVAKILCKYRPDVPVLLL
jgi:hypothetical protein